MKHRWLVYALVACGLAVWNAARGIGPLHTHGIVFLAGMLCFFRWIEGLHE